MRRNGPRPRPPCGGLPTSILESELFGHARGAFTGALRERKGYFERADHGTIFLDEVAELTPAAQVKLLRILENRTFERVGGERTIHVNARTISASNRDLQELVAAGEFREDLYFRLGVFPIYVPPLRERPGDIPVLAAHFLAREAERMGRTPPSISQAALDAMRRHRWPGNVRELQNAMKYVLLTCGSSTVKEEHLPPALLERTNLRSIRPPDGMTGPQIARAIAEARGNKSKAAVLLGVSRSTLYRFLSASAAGTAPSAR